MTERKRVLAPLERLSEVMYGLIIVLTFTSTFSVATASRAGVRELLIAAVGCSAAWGIVDAVMYLVGKLSERGRQITILRALRCSRGPDEARELLFGAMPPLLAERLQPAEWLEMGARLSTIPVPERPRLAREDYVGAIGIFLLGFLATVPVAIPFLVMADPRLALRTSNLVAAVLLFLVGLGYGRYAGYPSWRLGVTMVALAGILVAVTVALGG